MGKPSDRCHIDTVDLGDPDLVPIMSILCILIPILIFSFVLYEIKVQEVALPKFGGGGGGGGAKLLTLAVLVTKDHHMIKIQSGTEEKDVREILLKKVKARVCAPTLPCEECAGEEYDEYDYAGLYTQIVKLKESKAFAEVDSINIGAEDGIPWKVMAKTIDAVRTKLDGTDLTNLCTYSRAKPARIHTTDADGRETATVIEMFPKIVFVML